MKRDIEFICNLVQENKMSEQDAYKKFEKSSYYINNVEYILVYCYLITGYGWKVYKLI